MLTDHRGRQVPLCDFDDLTATSFEEERRTGEEKNCPEPWKSEHEVANYTQTLSGLLIAAFGAVGMAVFPVIIEPFFGPQTFLTHLLLTFAVAGLFVRPLSQLMAYKRRAHTRGTLALAYITAKRCPSCAQRLDSPPDPDGCTPCQSCGAAWRIPQPQPAQPEYLRTGLNDSPASRASRGECPWCGYNRAGLATTAPCPECGSPREYPVIHEPPPPPGRAVCARCRGDMRGREKNRTCPSCGVMYGVDYVLDTDPA